MYYGEIKNCDIANGTGVRVSLFVSGCTHHCKGCFNPMTWDFCYGKPYGKAEEDRIVSLLAPSYIAGLSLLGGEPCEPQNITALLPLLRRVKSELPNKTIWCYTGYTFEKDLLSRIGTEKSEAEEFLRYIDILVDGEFILEKKNIQLKFRGSENQRIIDVKKSLAEGKTILWESM